MPRFHTPIGNTMKRHKIPQDAEKEPEFGSADRSLPFSVPDGYFEALPRDIERRIALMNPEASASEPSGFDTPADYFNQLEDAIRHRIHGGTVRSIRWWKQPEWSLSIAAMLICLFLGTHTYFRQRTVQYTAVSQQLSVDEVSEAIDYLDLDVTTVASLLSANDESSTGEQELQQYLLDNDIDLSQLEL